VRHLLWRAVALTNLVRITERLFTNLVRITERFFADLVRIIEGAQR